MNAAREWWGRSWQRLADWLDYFVPEETRLLANRLTRDRVLVGYILLQLVVLPAAACYLFFSSSVTWSNRWQAAVVILGMTGAYAIWLELFRRGLPRIWVTHGVVGMAFAVVFAAILMTGGPNASTIPLLLILIPALGFCLGGERHGLVWTMLTIVGLAILRRLEISQQFVLVPLSEVAVQQIDNVVWGISLFSLGGILMVYEQMYRWYNRRLYHERQLYYQQAHLDNLTGLANRRAFESSLRLRLDEAERGPWMAVLFYIDLDDFKPINDRFGHAVGDWVLCQVAQRIRSCLRDSDIGARLGGDEFAVLISQLQDVGQTQEIAQRLQAALSSPLRYGDQTIPVKASIGSSVFPRDAKDAEQLLKIADQSMYRDKHRFRQEPQR